MLEMLENDERGERIVFSYATFRVTGRVNRHNVQIWGSEYPQKIVEYIRDSPKLNVFAAIRKRKLYEPFFAEPCWICLTGRDDEALLKWPPRSQDMTSCDFFLWSSIKDITSRSGGAARGIRNELAAVTRDMLVRVWTQMDYRLDICRVMKSTHIKSM
ncbi:uncharacterized protein TNCT_318451 [Trichonephila clavata]|uniref:Uncharacterized protein n=1 Tax=Trichonephila clavata TaxID=2740835 RepID=A0A8X6GND5_TRICU|nr:uncharacterized protein TNCT_318451 [Trichonephila clavata]